MRRVIGPLLAGLLCACGPQVALDALAPAGSVRVVAAASGDTLTLEGGAQVRLAGVEAPHGDEPYAAQAQAALTRLAVGREIELLQGGAPMDSYGRTLAQVRQTGSRLWLEGALLREGAVRVRTYDDNRALARLMLDQEAHARIKRRGLWALAAYRVRLPQEVGAGARGLVVVEGRVGQVVRLGGVLRLTFAEAPGGLVVQIPRPAWDDFAAAGVVPAALVGKLVRLRGGAQPGRDRPVMWLDHPNRSSGWTSRPANWAAVKATSTPLWHGAGGPRCRG